MRLIKRLFKSMHVALMRWLFGEAFGALDKRMRSLERRQVIQDDELLDQMHELTSTKEQVGQLTDLLKRSIYQLTEPSSN